MIQRVSLMGIVITLIGTVGAIPGAWAQSVSPDSPNIYSVNPSFQTMRGVGVSSLGLGQPTILNLAVHNNMNEDFKAVIFWEVRDSDGVTWHAAWYESEIDANGDVTIRAYWLPSESGDYTIRTFVLSSLSNPEALSSIRQSNILSVN